MSRARFIAAARLEFLAEVIYYSEAQAGLGGRFTAAVEEAAARALAFPLSGSSYRSNTRRSSSRIFRSRSSTGPNPKESSSLRSHTMRDVLITGNHAYVPANHRIDADRFAAGHAGRCLHMEDAPETKDRSGRTVRVGNRVRILRLSQDFLESLPEDERPLVLEMLGNIFEVDEIDEHGSAWVTKWWDRGDGTYDAHGIGLSCAEMELAPEENAG